MVLGSDDIISDEYIKECIDQLRCTSTDIIGSEQQILVEKLSKKSQYQVTGRTENMRWVNFDADSSYIGQFVNIIVTEALPNSLSGRMI